MCLHIFVNWTILTFESIYLFRPIYCNISLPTTNVFKRTVGCEINEITHVSDDFSIYININESPRFLGQVWAVFLTIEQ